MADVEEGDFTFPFGEFEDEEVEAMQSVEQDKEGRDVVDPFPQELPFAQWHAVTDLTAGTRGLRYMTETEDSHYNWDIYSPAANTTHNFVRAYFMMTRRRDSSYVKGDVRFIAQLPLDILLEVFQHLHPLDIYNILLADRSLEVHVKPSLWKAVWDNQTGIPSKPPTLSYPQWAKLWFGPAICEQCRMRAAQPDFACSKRYCSKCLSRKIEHLYDDAENESGTILWCCPVAGRTNGYSINGSHRFGSGWRFIQDLKQVRLRLKELNDDISNGVSRASEAKAEWIDATKYDATELTLHAMRCHEYSETIFDTYKDIKDGDMKKMVEKMKKRLLYTEGFTKDELPDFGYDLDRRCRDERIISIKSRLFKRAWSTLVLPAAGDCRDRYHASIIRRREKVIEVAYEDYQKEKLKPEVWWRFPSANAVVKMGPCRAYTHDMEAPEPMAADGVELVKQVEALLPEWFEETRKSIGENFIKDEKSWLDALNIDASESGGYVEEPKYDVLDLAVSVFTCRCCDLRYGRNEVGVCMFGWEGVSKHLCCRGDDDDHTSFMLNVASSNAVRAVLDRLGLDPRTTSGKELDDLGYRFMCMDCKESPQHMPPVGRLAFHWRGLVKHVTDGHFNTPERPMGCQWEVLSPEAVVYVRPRETRYPERVDPAWSCNHCAVHYDELAPYKAVLSHLKGVHDIQEAKTGTDLVHMPHTHHTLFTPIVVPIAPHNLRCLACPEDKSVLTWFDEQGLLQHLRGKHKITFSNEEENQSWKAVDMFLP